MDGWTDRQTALDGKCDSYIPSKNFINRHSLKFQFCLQATKQAISINISLITTSHLKYLTASQQPDSRSTKNVKEPILPIVSSETFYTCSWKAIIHVWYT